MWECPITPNIKMSVQQSRWHLSGLKASKTGESSKHCAALEHCLIICFSPSYQQSKTNNHVLPAQQQVLSSEPEDFIVQLGHLSEGVNMASPVRERHTLSILF